MLVEVPSLTPTGILTPSLGSPAETTHDKETKQRGHCRPNSRVLTVSSRGAPKCSVPGRACSRHSAVQGTPALALSMVTAHHMVTPICRTWGSSFPS